MNGTHDTVEKMLAAAREMLDMDIAYLSEFRGGVQRVRDVDGDAESFGLVPGREIPLEETYCRRMIAGEIPCAIPDTRREPGVSGLAATAEARIGAYVGVPVVLSDGSVYGTLCCAHHDVRDMAPKDVRFLELLAQLAAQTVDREEENRRLGRLRLRSEALGALLASLEARDHYTGDHSTSVVELAEACAGRLGCSEEELADVRQVAFLHDIGKIGIPDEILHKPGPLSSEEWSIMHQHPEIGAQIIASVDSLRHLVPAIRAEHERFDGGGYPDGLAGTEIPLASRVVFACDAYHAMVSDRPYRRALSREAALGELVDNAGSQFDPRVVGALVASLGYEASPPRSPAPASVLH